MVKRGNIIVEGPHALWIPADLSVKCDDCGFGEYTGQVARIGAEARSSYALLICKRRGGICKALKVEGGVR